MEPYLPPDNAMPSSIKRGLVVLLILIISLLIIRFTLPQKSFENHDFSEFDRQIELYNQAIEEAHAQEQELFPFNPNTSDVEAMKKGGLSAKQAYTIVKYRNAGGVFKTPSDLKKIYSVSDSLYVKIEPYIQIEKSPIVESNKTFKQKKEKKAKSKHAINTKELRSFDKEYTNVNRESVELNSADSIQLLKVYGVGPAFASRIIKYRNFLGGYVNKMQLNEVYGMRKENYEQIEPNVHISLDSIVKIDLNSATFQQIHSHPYTTYNHTKALVRYRDIMEKFDSVEVIIQNHLMDSSDYFKLKPYLCAN